jgi:hypothetical protein
MVIKSFRESRSPFVRGVDNAFRRARRRFAVHEETDRAEAASGAA